MDVKSAFLYGNIKEEVYVCQPLGFVDPEFLEKVYKVEKALYGLHQALRAWCETHSTYLLDNGFHMGQIDKTLFIKRLKGDILLVQVYVNDIIFGSTKKSLCDEFEQITHNMFQMSSMGELTFFLGLQVKQKEDGIFISQDNDYAGASLDRKSTIGGCQFLGSRLISWQCKKQTVVANLTTKAEYITASHCCGQVLWIQNQMLDYGFNFMQTKIYVNNKSAICVIKNPAYHSKTNHIEIRHHFIRDSYKKRLIVMIKIHTDHNVANLLTKAFDNHVYHSKTKHIEIRHHFIRDSYEKRLTEMVKIHTDNNVADLLTKAFDVSKFNFLGASIGKRGRDTKIPQSGGPLIKVGDEAVHKELENPTTYVSFIKQFWRTTTAGTSANREVELTATIDGQVKTITESSLRRHLKLEDNGGVTTLPNSEIFEQLTLMGVCD
ncbi:putative ribonuclease H-like domain-containing protein [Tanacetum coccineum]